MRRCAFRDQENLAEVVKAAEASLADGGVLLIPTETFYGLGAMPADRSAEERIYAMKGRPSGLGLSILCATWSQVVDLVVIPESYRRDLILTWPGPLTAVLPSRSGAHGATLATLAVRIPGHGLLRTLLERVGPLTGTSANRHGRPPCTTAESALASLLSPPDLVLDGGTTQGGLASTLVDLSGPESRILRPGPLEWPRPGFGGGY